MPVVARTRPRFSPVLVAALWCGLAATTSAQTARDSAATIVVVVRHDSLPVASALVSSGRVTARTGATGAAVLRLVAGSHEIVVSRLGFVADTLTVIATADSATTVFAELIAVSVLDVVMVASTRAERRIEDEPVRVEVLGREEIEEKLLMTPGDITMMLNETSGLRVQTTSPSLGGANVRIQGMRGRYVQLLSDGLPLYGGQAGGLGLLQIPPVDLGQVEVIKGAASALYGSSALGGVINLISRRPSDAHERELLLNQTSRNGSDGVLWLSGPASDNGGYSLLAGAHRQSQTDIDGDGWTDLAGYERIVARPRFVWADGVHRSLFVTAGVTAESREGGTMPARTAPSGEPFGEALRTRRVDAGVVGRRVFSAASVSVRASAMEQRHDHDFGPVRESDRHRTGFAELATTWVRGTAATVAGIAVQRDDYRSFDLAGFDYAHTVSSLFAQHTLDATSRVALTANARVDNHSAYGAFFNPRVSALLRLAHEWSARASVGSGTFAPSPFTDETEVTGLGVLEPLRDVTAERAVTASMDVGGPAGAFELNATVFASRITSPLGVAVSASDASRLVLVNADEPTRTHGAEAFVRWRAGAFAVTGTHTFIASTELDLDTGVRRDVPLTPRHATGVVAMWEEEDRGRVGLEFYVTGRQALADNPYRTSSRPYVILGLLIERHIGPVRAFVNAENLTNTRQTRYDPLVRPAPGAGGRWTTDAWTELSGRTVNGGIRWAFGARSGPDDSGGSP